MTELIPTRNHPSPESFPEGLIPKARVPFPRLWNFFYQTCPLCPIGLVLGGPLRRDSVEPATDLPMGRDMPDEDVTRAPADAAPAWDDDKFVARVQAIAAAKGTTVGAVSRRAGLAEDYFVKRGGGRGRNIVSIVRLAGALGVPVSELVDPPANPPEPPPAPSIDPVKLERLALVANVAAHLYLTLDARRATVPDDVDADELLQLLMRFVEPRRRSSRR